MAKTKTSLQSKTQAIGAIAIMAAALLWSLDGVFIRPALYQYSALVIVFLEHLLGLVVLSPFLFRGWYRIKTLSRKDWFALGWVSLLGGLIGTLAITQAFFSAVHGEVTFAAVVILQKLQPVFALLLARLLLREHLPPRFYAWAGLAITAGYALAFGQSGMKINLADLGHQAAFLAVIAAFAFGSSTVFGKRLVNHLDFKTATALRFGLTSLITGPIIVMSGQVPLLFSLNPGAWRLLAIIVFSSGALAMFVYYFGLRRVAASTASICELFWPLSAVFLDYLLNANTLTIGQIAASLFLFFAIWRIVRYGQGYRLISFTANAVAGRGRGRRIGIPTINLDKTGLDLPHGIYICRAVIDDREFIGLLHFGRKETFGEEVSTELYITEDLKTGPSGPVRIKILRRLRDIRAYKSPEALRKQVGEDVGALKNYVIKSEQ